MKSRTELNIHATRFISLIFEDTLRSNGFSCPNGKKIHWYRKNGEDLLDCISFETSEPHLPIHKLTIRYEVIPLFLRIHYLPGVSAKNIMGFLRPGTKYASIDDEPNVERKLRLFSDDIRVVAPTLGSKGLYALTGVVLPYFATIKTLEECYSAHKDDCMNVYLRDKEDKRCIYKDLLDEAINMGDYEVCENSLNWAEDMVNSYQKSLQMWPNSKVHAEVLLHWQQLHHAISNNAYKEYIEILMDKRAANLKWIGKVIGDGLREP